jgi:hypothetical protein
MIPTKLVHGNIPARTDCPFTSSCPMSENKTCAHRGVEHQVEFSCAVARAYDLIGLSPKTFSE